MREGIRAVKIYYLLEKLVAEEAGGRALAVPFDLSIPLIRRTHDPDLVTAGGQAYRQPGAQAGLNWS
jgi:hypothetical protein